MSASYLLGLHGPQQTPAYNNLKVYYYSFLKDEHTYGKEMAEDGREIVIYQYLPFPIRL